MGFGVLTLFLLVLLLAKPVSADEQPVQQPIVSSDTDKQEKLPPAIDFFPQGPMRYSNDLITQTFVMVPVAERAALPSRKGQWSCQLGFTNQFIKQNDGSTIVDIDMEEYKVTAFYRRRVSEECSWGVDIPIRFQSSGFLDEYIQTFHNLFGMPNSDRGDYADGDFAMLVMDSKNGIGWNSSEGEFGLSDIVLHGRYSLGEYPHRASSFRAALKIPTATVEDFTSGRPDLALGLAHERLVLRDWYLFTELNHTWTTSLHNHGFRTANRWSGSATVEYRYNRAMTFFTQANFMEPGLITGNYDTDRDSTSLVVGTHWKSGGCKYSAAFTEDITLDTAPDFGLLFTINF